VSVKPAQSNRRKTERPRIISVVFVWSIAACETRFNKTRNPDYVWDALHLALESGVPPPAWVTAYFRRVSSRMYEMGHTTSTPQREMPRAVYRALEFDPARRNNPLRAAANEIHEFLIACQVLPRLLQPDSKLDAAIKGVETDHPAVCELKPKCDTISYSTVARAWKKHAQVLQASVDDCLELNRQLDELRQGRLPGVADRVASIIESAMPKGARLPIRRRIVLSKFK
jgi:hypothetical protein